MDEKETKSPKVPELGQGLKYVKLAVDVPYNIWYCVDPFDPVHDSSDERSQDTLYIYIDDPEDELIIGVSYDAEGAELICPGFKRPATFNTVMQAILGPLTIRWNEENTK